MKNALPISLIRLYQRHLSPRKGFRCAHDIWFETGGCSGYAINALQQLPLWGALRATKRRMLFCRNIALALANVGMDSGDVGGHRHLSDSRNPPEPLHPSAKWCLTETTAQGAACCLPFWFA